MNIKYDESADAMYLYLSNNPIVDSEEIDDGVIYDYDENDHVVRIEILFVKKRTPEEIKQLNFPFSLEDKEQFKKIFSLAFA